MKKEILFQLDMAWKLFEYHCNELDEAEVMWCKSENGLQIRRNGDKWIVDWPTTEDYAIGPCSIAWTMWHILYWWNTTLIASKENYIIEKEDVKWPGNIKAVIREINRCHEEWVAFIESMSEEELLSDELCHWPFSGQSMATLALWLNSEFMKNVAEIGTCRFLYAIEVNNVS